MKKIKPLMSRDTQRPVKPLEPEPFKRGPTTRDLNPDLTPKGLTPFEYCVKHALADEWPILQKIVAARVVAEPAFVWEACQKCGFVFQRAFRTKAGRPCISCNYPGYENGGFMRDMSEAEISAHLAAKAKADGEIREREKRAELYRVNQARQAEGRKPLTMDELLAHEKAKYERRIGDQRRADANRTERDHRVAMLPRMPAPDVTLVQGSNKPVVGPVKRAAK